MENELVDDDPAAATRFADTKAIHNTHGNSDVDVIVPISVVDKAEHSTILLISIRDAMHRQASWRWLIED